MKGDDYTDQTPMPWGVHKGKPMAEVPASYLDWLRDQDFIKRWPKLWAYIKDNASRIDAELDKQEPEDKDHGKENLSTFDDFLSDL